MNAVNDELTNAEAIAFCVFLLSEKERHLQDVDKIEDRFEEAIIKFKLTLKDRTAIMAKSSRYVDF